MSQRIVNLEVNESGAWKRITSFDLNTFEDGDLEHHAQALLQLSANKNIRARIIAPGDTAPLMNWRSGDGWREWRKPA